MRWEGEGKERGEERGEFVVGFSKVMDQLWVVGLNRWGRCAYLVLAYISWARVCGSEDDFFVLLGQEIMLFERLGG